jgi:hypothetical protein
MDVVGGFPLADGTSAKALTGACRPSIQALGKYGPAVYGSLDDLAGWRRWVVVPGIVPFMAGAHIPISGNVSGQGLPRTPVG